MDEQEISGLYQTLPNERVKLYGTYTTRPEGFVDILLSRLILSSQEAYKLLGSVKTHRGTCMAGKELSTSRNEYISLSPGRVSFKYFNSELESYDKFEGGVGIFVPLSTLLEYEPINFIHTPEIGELGMYDVTKENIEEAVHRARKKGELKKGTGFGYIFETMLCAQGEYRKWTHFPRIDLEDPNIIVAAPKTMKQEIYREIRGRQQYYERFLETLQDGEIRERGWDVFDGRNIFYPDETQIFLERMIEPFDERKLNMMWYSERNLEVALERVSLR